MKKIILLISFLTSFVGFAQEPNSPTNKKEANAFAFEPLALFGSGLQVGYDRELGKYYGFKLIAGYYINDEPWVYDAKEMSGFNTQVIFKKYLSKVKTGEMRFYFGLTGLYKEILLTDFSEGSYVEGEDLFGNPAMIYQEDFRDINVNAIGVGLLIGSSVKFKNKFYMDYSLGGALLVSDDEKEDLKDAHIAFVNPYLNGIIPRFNVGFGFAF